MLNFGATLRLLRLESGLGLRDLARRIGVSSAYLSRVESGLDPVPTPERLDALARTLGLPPALLLELAHRVSPIVADYVEQVPAAGPLFLEIAHRGLDGAQIARLRALLDEHFPRPKTAAVTDLSDLLAPERIVLQLKCAEWEDVIDVAAGRLAAGVPGASPRDIAEALIRRGAQVPPAVGGGVAVPGACLAGAPAAAALITLARPLPCPTPDAAPLRLVVAQIGPPDARDRLLRLARLARLAARGLADQLEPLTSPAQVQARLALLESLD